MLICPKCKSTKLIKAGYIVHTNRYHGRRRVIEKQRYKCKHCGLHTTNPKRK